MLFYQYLRVLHVLDPILIKICLQLLDWKRTHVQLGSQCFDFSVDIHTVKYVYTVCKVSLSLSLDKLAKMCSLFSQQGMENLNRCGAKTSYNEEINLTQRGRNPNVELKRQKSNLCNNIVCQVKQHRSLVKPKKYILKANTNWTCRPTCHLWHDICCTPPQSNGFALLICQWSFFFEYSI